MAPDTEPAPNPGSALPRFAPPGLVVLCRQPPSSLASEHRQPCKAAKSDGLPDLRQAPGVPRRHVGAPEPRRGEAMGRGAEWIAHPRPGRQRLPSGCLVALPERSGPPLAGQGLLPHGLALRPRLPLLRQHPPLGDQFIGEPLPEGERGMAPAEKRRQEPGSGLGRFGQESVVALPEERPRMAGGDLQPHPRGEGLPVLCGAAAHAGKFARRPLPENRPAVAP